MSFRKDAETKARNVMKNINVRAINRRIYKRIQIKMNSEGINTELKFTKYMIGSFRVRQTQRTNDLHSYEIHNKILQTGKGNKVITRESKSGNKWKITHRNILKMFLYGREQYKVPKSISHKSKHGLLVFNNYGKTIIYNWKSKGQITIPKYPGTDYRDYVKEEMMTWLSSIQDRFLEKGFG